MLQEIARIAFFDPRKLFDKYGWWSDEDGAFIAEAPELPGCMADGETRQAALLALERVMEEWIETAQAQGREIPRH